jgi:hypothetical protein
MFSVVPQERHLLGSLALFALTAGTVIPCNFSPSLISIQRLVRNIRLQFMNIGVLRPITVGGILPQKDNELKAGVKGKRAGGRLREAKINHLIS